ENKKLRIENQRAASVLGQTRERLQIAMDSTELGTWDYSPDENKLSLCDRCIHVHSINKTVDLRPIDFLRSIDKRDRKEFIENISALAKSGETRNFRMNYRVKDEEELHNSVWISLRGKVYFDQNLKFERLSGVLIDVSETKWLEEKLRSAVALAETSNHAKSSFLANMSHEIRTPLSAMIGFAEIMANDRVDPLDVINFSNSIVSNGKKLLRIIDEVLDLSKVEKGKLDIDMHKFSLAALLVEVEATLSPIAAKKQIQFSVEYSAVQNKFYFSDEGRIRQILMNVLGNALKFTDHGSVHFEVREHVLSSGFAILEFIVSDTGIGISPEQEAKLFSPFQQADLSTTRRFGGTGLGLVLSRKLCEALHGHFVLQSSELGKGSTFVASVKVQIVSDVLLADAPDLNLLIADDRLDNLSILVVDDAMDNQFLINRALTKKGARVSLADDGKQALDIASREKFDIILMDMQMPEIDGLTATRLLRERGVKTPVVALTAHAMIEEKKAAYAAGCQAHVSKPIDFPLLYQNILELVKSPAGHTELLH
ncbi:MAG: response regulator, partial [Proteobacteria bacterium]